MDIQKIIAVLEDLNHAKNLSEAKNILLTAGSNEVLEFLDDLSIFGFALDEEKKDNAQWKAMIELSEFIDATLEDRDFPDIEEDNINETEEEFKTYAALLYTSLDEIISGDDAELQDIQLYAEIVLDFLASLSEAPA